MDTADGDRHATTKVDCRASVGVTPGCASADVKWDLSSAAAGAARESDGPSAITVPTKSAMAASGALLDHDRAGMAAGLGTTSMIWAARFSQMFSMPARANRVGSLGRMGATAPRP